tara:strand:- start:235 stop:1413 length:1179 start_codon:yes stop_codon:yes gene_type:complete
LIDVMAKSIYLDNQATTPVDPEVINVMLPFFQEKFGNASSIHHSYGLESKEAVERARKILAESINANTREIIFTSGATEAINLAIKGIAGRYKNKRHIITQVTEHSAVLDTYRSMGRKGWDVTILPVNSNGMIEPKSVRDAITDETVLISIMHANNEIGTIQPINQIGEICRKNNILFFVDACQSYGKLEIDINTMNINLLAATAHKLYGPKGIGFLYIRQKNPKVTVEMQIDGGGHERGFRSGTLPVPLIVGFAKAVEISLQKRKSEYVFLKKLRDNLFYGIKSKHPDVIVNGSMDNGLSHNLNLCFPGLDSETLIMKMKGIACSAGSACSSTNLEPSHVIKALGRDNELALSAIRFSVGRFNTQEEIESAIIEVNSVVNTIKSGKIKRRT